MTLSYQRRARIQQALEQANSHPVDRWYLGTYDGDKKILALTANIFTGEVYQGEACLYFRTPHYVRMPTGCSGNPRFELGSWKAARGFTPPPEWEGAELFVISIDAWDTTFCIVCEDVRFYHASKPANPIIAEDESAA